MIAPLLTIAIPTYNRPKKLEALFEKCLKPILDNYSEIVSIVVCDNSDVTEAENNRALLAKSKVCYIKNAENLGYAGNIVKCMKEAGGSYLWYLSDDDDVCLEEVFLFLKVLPQLALKNFECIFLPILSSDGLGNDNIINTSAFWGVENGVKMRDLLNQNNQFPFVLFSSAVFSLKNLDQNTLLRVEGKFKGNDFIQIPLFLDILTTDASLYFYPRAVIYYNATGDIRFSLRNLASSMNSIIDYYWSQDTLHYKIYSKRSFRTWMGWFLLDRSGLYRVPEASLYHSSLINFFVKKGWSIPNLVLLVLSFFPSFILRGLYKIRNALNKRP